MLQHPCPTQQPIPRAPPRPAPPRPQAPKQLQTIFEANLDLLLSIFNPQGHLDITYLDADWRVGRDDKGNVFLLQRA